MVSLTLRPMRLGPSMTSLALYRLEPSMTSLTLYWLEQWVTSLTLYLLVGAVCDLPDLVLVGAVGDGVAVLGIPQQRARLPPGTVAELLGVDAPGVGLHHAAHRRPPAGHQTALLWMWTGARVTSL